MQSSINYFESRLKELERFTEEHSGALSESLTNHIFGVINEYRDDLSRFVISSEKLRELGIERCDNSECEELFNPYAGGVSNDEHTFCENCLNVE